MPHEVTSSGENAATLRDLEIIVLLGLSSHRTGKSSDNPTGSSHQAKAEDPSYTGSKIAR